MTQVLHLKVSLHGKAEDVFTYFTNKKKLQGWLTAVAEVEPKIGGKYELFWDPTNRQNNSTIGCRITAFEEGRLIAFDWKSPEQFKLFANSADPLTHVVVLFAPNGKQTEVHLIHSGWRSTNEWQQARAWQEKAWKGAFNALEKEINRR